MLEMYDCTLEEFATKTILDPTCGSGNLIMAALIAGISISKDYPKNVFGNELSLKPLELCRKRFTYYCKTHGMEYYDKDFWKHHLHLGNALNPDCKDGFRQKMANQKHLKWEKYFSHMIFADFHIFSTKKFFFSG